MAWKLVNLTASRHGSRLLLTKLSGPQLSLPHIPQVFAEIQLLFRLQHLRRLLRPSELRKELPLAVCAASTRVHIDRSFSLLFLLMGEFPVLTSADLAGKKYHLVKPLQPCADIIEIYDIDKEDFTKWNPSVREDCSNLWANFHVCVDAPGTLTGVLWLSHINTF